MREDWGAWLDEVSVANIALQIDLTLASALRGETVDAAGLRIEGAHVNFVIDRIKYHGVAGLLADQLGAMAGWPLAIAKSVRGQAIAQAMWELRHRVVLAELLESFSTAQIVAILLKGTAVAYDLYPSPAARARGDTDVLIDAQDLERARLILQGLGYHRQSADWGDDENHTLQEVWSLARDGETQHHIDLHWQLMNAPALGDFMPFAECLTERVALTRLSPAGFAMDRVRALLHCCAHRAMHFTTPYFVDGVTYYGGDRLIWVHDIHLLAEALSDDQWATLCALSEEKGVSAVCLDGLTAAQRFLATKFPGWVSERLRSATGEAKPSTYLLRSRQFGRAWQDLSSIPDFSGKLAYLRARSLPSPAFIRGKYPRMARMPLPLLYARRMLDLLRARPDRSGG